MFHVERRSVRYAVRRSAGRYPRLGWRIMIRLVAIVLVACWVVSVRLLVDIGAAGCRVDIVPLPMSRIVYRLAFIVLVAVDAVARGLMAAGVHCVTWLAGRYSSRAGLCIVRSALCWSCRGLCVVDWCWSVFVGCAACVGIMSL